MQTSEAIHPDKHDREQGGTALLSCGSVLRFQPRPDGFCFFCERVNVAVSFVRDDIVRIRTFTDEQPDWGATMAVALQPDSVPVDIVDTSTEIILASSRLTVRVARIPFTLSVTTADGEIVHRLDHLCADHRGSVIAYNESYADSHFYGLGEKTGFLDKRGERYEMWNSDVYAPHVPEIEALYVSIPFLIHFRPSVTYGLFLDNPGYTVFDMRSESQRYSVRASTGGLDYYVLFGPQLKSVVQKFTQLTGRMPLPPKWSIGYHQSRYSYMDETEVMALARTFREKQIPCDAIYLDIHYMDGYRVFTFDHDRFPNPEAMIEALASDGFHVVPIVDPGVKRDPKYSVYLQGVEGQHFCRKAEGELFHGEVWPGDSVFPDFSDDRVRRWWGENHRFYTDLGIRGIWNDMNEPAVFNDSKTMDLDVVHSNDGRPKTHEELHNLYGLLMAKATYDGLRQLQQERPFVLTRAGYAGVQRYAAVWTGDNRSFWEHMQMAMPMVLNLGLSGIAFAGADIGGFAHHVSGELLARWTQMGAFFPFCRNHSGIDSVRQEPWTFGPEIEEICRKYIRLRYHLLPYIYILFWQSAETGVPVMRPLLLEYPDDPEALNLCDQFLLGSDFLVAPVCRPGASHRMVYLPEGIWYNYWTGERVRGRRHVVTHAPLATLPLFVRAGAIIPVADPAPHTGAQEAFRVLEVYAGQRGMSSAEVYEDDGITFAHQQGEYNRIRVEVSEDPAALSVRLRYVHRGYAVKRSALTLRIRHLSFAPGEVTGADGQPLAAVMAGVPGWAVDPQTRDLWLTVPDDGAERVYVVREVNERGESAR